MRGAAIALALVAAPALAAEGRPADDLAASLAAADAVAARPLAAVLADLDAILLAGEPLPPDFLAALTPLPPAERLLAVAYARRAGLLTGQALPLDRLLAGDAR